MRFALGELWGVNVLILDTTLTGFVSSFCLSLFVEVFDVTSSQSSSDSSCKFVSSSVKSLLFPLFFLLSDELVLILFELDVGVEVGIDKLCCFWYIW